MKTRTVRELGGEIWAELRRVEGIKWQDLNEAIDIVMAVLARYENTMIVNDKDLPVEPLPREEAKGH